MPLGFIAFQQNGALGEAACAARHSAPEAALWSRPRVAISSVQARPVSPNNAGLQEMFAENAEFRYKYSVLTRARWPVLTRPLMAGFHMATKGRSPSARASSPPAETPNTAVRSVGSATPNSDFVHRRNVLDEELLVRREALRLKAR